MGGTPTFTNFPPSLVSYSHHCWQLQTSDAISSDIRRSTSNLLSVAYLAWLSFRLCRCMFLKPSSSAFDVRPPEYR